MNIFIDTNVFLSFFHLTSDELEELKKLAVLAGGGEATLFLPEQVKSEFRRNRANKIADAIKRLEDQRWAEYPQICKQYGEYENLREAQGDYEKHHAKLIEQIDADAGSRSLAADAVIEELFGVAQVIPYSSSLIERARLRSDIGNPPGKKGSLGDAINWEALVEIVPHGEDLHFISEDKDYFSALNTEAMDPFLLDEWSQNKGSQLHVYKRLSSFFRDQFPEIELATELEKDLLIAELATSSRFVQTHAVISKLSRFSDFTQAQVDEIVAAAITNNQVRWTGRDPDVNEFLTRLIAGREEQLDPGNLRCLYYVLNEMEPYGEIPLLSDLLSDF